MRIMRRSCQSLAKVDQGIRKLRATWREVGLSRSGNVQVGDANFQKKKKKHIQEKTGQLL